MLRDPSSTLVTLQVRVVVFIAYPSPGLDGDVTITVDGDVVFVVAEDDPSLRSASGGRAREELVQSVGIDDLKQRRREFYRETPSASAIFSTTFRVASVRLLFPRWARLIAFRYVTPV